MDEANGGDQKVLNHLPIPKVDIQVLNQEIIHDEGIYRIRARDRVHYLTIPTNVFDDDTMCIPSLLIPQLPDFPDESWTKMSVSRATNGVLESTISFEPLPELQQAWHENRVDILSLNWVRRHRSGVHEVSYQGLPAIAKYARFEHDYPQLDRETWAYFIIHEYRNVEDPQIAPKVLGHLTENGRVMGLLLEKLDGCRASIEDLPRCEKALQILHDEPIRLIHGDVNRHNFIVNPQSNCIHMVDFEFAEEFDEAKAQAELASLASELVENTGRGSTIDTIRQQ